MDAMHTAGSRRERHPIFQLMVAYWSKSAIIKRMTLRKSSKVPGLRRLAGGMISAGGHDAFASRLGEDATKRGLESGPSSATFRSVLNSAVAIGARRNARGQVPEGREMSHQRECLARLRDAGPDRGHAVAE